MSDALAPSEMIRNQVDPYRRLAVAVINQRLVEYRELKREIDEARPWYAYSHRRARVNEWAQFELMPDLYRDVQGRLDEVTAFLTQPGWVHELSGVPAEYIAEGLARGVDLSPLSPILERIKRKGKKEEVEDDSGEA